MAETMEFGGRSALEGHMDLAALFDDAVTGMAIVGLDGRFQAVNPALCRMLGYPQQDLVGRRTTDLTHPDDRPPSRAALQRLLSGESRTDQLHKRYVRPDGSTVSAVRTTTVLRDGDGNPTGLFSQIIDVTPLAEMQAAIGSSERRFKALVAHASDLIVLLDREGRIRYASPAAGRVLGYEPEEVEGRSVFDYLDPRDHERARQGLGEHIATSGASEPVEYRVRHHDGGWREVEVVTTNLFDDPSVGALVVNVRDVTEQAEYRRRLEAGERRFRTLVANAWDVISLHDTEGRYLYCSPAISRLGYRPEQLVGADPFGLIHPDDHPGVAEVFRQVADGQRQAVTVEYRFRHRDGTWLWMESIAERRLDDPSVAAVVITTRDVTLARRRARQQQAVAELGHDALRGGPVENLLERIPGIVADALGVPHCHVVQYRPDGTRTVMYSSDPADARPLLPGEADCAACAEASPPGAPCPVVRRAAREEGAPAGADRFAGSTTVPINAGTGPDRALVVCSSRPERLGAEDLAFLETAASILAAALSRRSVEGELRHQAVHDGLTDLPNRTLLKDRLETALSRLGRHGGSVSVLFVDVDNFKLINDSLGHSVGDGVVAAIADRLRREIRSADTVGRFGGDEFVIVCEGADADDARVLAERIRQAVAAPLTVAGRAIAVTASIGCATTSDAQTSPDSLFADADMAMYEAKRTGKNSVAAFTPALRQRTTSHLETVSGIRRGLEASEFRLHYQPICELEAGGVTGYEALLRWQHPTSGLLLPDRFIDFAEASGLIVPLGNWVLETACAQSAAWAQAGRPAKVSINVSGLQLTTGDLTRKVEATLSDSGAAPDDIYLEVTENALIPDLEAARLALGALHDLGVHLGLDDFGTGWSSLSQLAWLPFDFVKIDRSFLRNLDTDQRTAAVLESISALCSTLGLRVIVEGVETPSQLEFLKQLDLPWAQGFLLGRPVPPEALS